MYLSDDTSFFFMNYKQYYKEYCFGYNWINNKTHKVYCSPHCPHLVGISKNGKTICEVEELRYEMRNL